jgi:hypothetical protein
MTGFIDFEDLKREEWEAWTPEEREEYQVALEDAKANRELAELV